MKLLQMDQDINILHQIDYVYFWVEERQIQEGEVHLGNPLDRQDVMFGIHSYTFRM